MSLYTLHTLATGGQTVAAPTLTSAEETRLDRTKGAIR